MTVDLWISIALAIPLSILANIVTPKVQRWVDSWFSTNRQRRATKRAQQWQKQLDALNKEFDEVQSLQSDPTKLTHHYLDALLWIAFIGAFGSLYAAIFGLMGELGSWEGVLGIAGRVGVQAVTLFTGTMIFSTAFKAIRAAKRVRNFETYAEKTMPLIGDLTSKIMDEHRTTP